MQPAFRLTPATAADVASICTELEGVPLAIEMAAARIRILSAHELLGRLRNKLKILTVAARDVPERQQTMRSTIEWSYDLLDQVERQLFRRLAVFAGEFHMEHVEHICCLDRESADGTLDTMASLVDKSMVRQLNASDGTAAFRLLSVIAEFAAELLAGSGEEASLRDRHACYFADSVTQAESAWRGPDQRQWFDRVEWEHDEVRAALRWFMDQGPTDERSIDRALEMGGQLWWYFYMRSRLREGRALLDELVTLAGQRKSVAHARVLTGAGYLAYHQGDNDRAQALHEASLALARELASRHGIAVALNDLGLVARARGDPAGARRLFNESLQLHQMDGNQGWSAISQFNLGKVVYEMGDPAEAQVLQDGALAMFRACGDVWGIAMSTGALGQMRYDQGAFPEARHLFELSLAYQQDLGDRRGMALTQMSLARTAWNLADYTLSRRDAEQALVIFREMGDRRNLAAALEAIGNIDIQQGDYDTARSLYTQSLQLRSEAMYRRGMASAYTNLGMVGLYAGDLESAAASLQLGVAIWRELGAKWGLARALNVLGRVAAARHDYTGAHAAFDEALALNLQVGSRRGEAASIGGLARLALYKRDVERCRILYCKVLGIVSDLARRGTWPEPSWACPGWPMKVATNAVMSC